jgi:hypothetical protein
VCETAALSPRHSLTFALERYQPDIPALLAFEDYLVSLIVSAAKASRERAGIACRPG